jgi:hypothetical protein
VQDSAKRLLSLFAVSRLDLLQDGNLPTLRENREALTSSNDRLPAYMNRPDKIGVTTNR